MSRRFIEERTYYPDGCDPDHYEAHSFGVGVYYRGNGKYMVARDRNGYQQLTRTRKWLWCPMKMNQMNWCRFTFEDACHHAELVVNDVVVNGRTWAQWEAWRIEKEKEAVSS